MEPQKEKIPNSPLLFVITPNEFNLPPEFWMKIAIQGQAIELEMTVNHQPVIVRLDDPKFLAQIFRQGMNLALSKFGHELWSQTIL